MALPSLPGVPGVEGRTRARTTKQPEPNQTRRSSKLSRSSATGGLLTQILAGRGLSAVSVAIDPVPFRGVLPLPISALTSGSPMLHNPANRNRAVPLTYEQFRYAFANAVSEDEAHQQLYKQFAVPTPGKPLFQPAAANLNPWTEAKVDTHRSVAGQATPAARRATEE
jgi:hypothetical protein